MKKEEIKFLLSGLINPENREKRYSCLEEIEKDYADFVWISDGSLEMNYLLVRSSDLDFLKGITELPNYEQCLEELYYSSKGRYQGKVTSFANPAILSENEDFYLDFWPKKISIYDFVLNEIIPYCKSKHHACMAISDNPDSEICVIYNISEDGNLSIDFKMNEAAFGKEDVEYDVYLIERLLDVIPTTEVLKSCNYIKD